MNAIPETMTSLETNNDDDFITTTIARLGANGRAFLRRLEPDSSLDAIESSLLPSDAAVLALDFDQTIKQKDPVTRQAHVRGGASSIAFLRRAHALGVALCVITAADVSAAGVRGIAGELDQLGIADLFDVEPIAVDPLLLAATPDDSVATLRSKLAALLVLVPPTRFANDLLRIACNSVSINDTSIEFRLVRNQQRGALLRITHPTIVHCWQQYHSKSNINTNIDDDTIMYFNDFNIDRDLIPMLHSLNIKDNHFNRLIQDTALIHDIDGVKIARFGRVFLFEI
jgi:hypothetical protein